MKEFEQNKEAVTERASDDPKVKETAHTKEFMPPLNTFLGPNKHVKYIYHFLF